MLPGGRICGKMAGMPRTARASLGGICYHVINRGNARMTEAEMPAIWTSVNRGTPWGNPSRQKRIAGRLGLESSLRPKGRPRLEKKK